MIYFCVCDTCAPNVACILGTGFGSVGESTPDKKLKLMLVIHSQLQLYLYICPSPSPRLPTYVPNL